MAPGNFAKRIKILGGSSVPHPSQVRKVGTKIISAAPLLSSASGESSIVSRKRKPIRPVRSTEGF